jgi:hypothetical protein
VKSLVGRNPAVSSTTVEATTNFAHQRPPVTEISLGPLELSPHDPPRRHTCRRVNVTGAMKGRHGDETDELWSPRSNRIQNRPLLTQLPTLASKHVVQSAVMGAVGCVWEALRSRT